MLASIENAAGLSYEPWKLTFTLWCNKNHRFSTCLHTEILQWKKSNSLLSSTVSQCKIWNSGAVSVQCWEKKFIFKIPKVFKNFHLCVPQATDTVECFPCLYSKLFKHSDCYWSLTTILTINVIIRNSHVSHAGLQNKIKHFENKTHT